MTDKTIKAAVLKNFKDAGTGAQFTKGDVVDLTEGQFGNYAAAGLVSEPDAEAKATAKAKAKAKIKVDADKGQSAA